MDDEKLKKQIGANLSAYRKRQGLTQAELAEKLNYSDKAVSKWERGDSVPDVLTLMQLADLFDITVNELVADPDVLPDNLGKMERVMGAAVERTLKRKADKKIILGLSTVLVWFVALFLFVVISSLGLTKSWLWFIYAVPANAIVLLSLRSAWKDFRWNKALISAIMWGALLSVYMSLLMFFHLNIWKMFLLGIPGQAAIMLWFRLYRKQPKEEQNG
jgi:transcriptional regulator with XRE-family HTH domain